MSPEFPQTHGCDLARSAGRESNPPVLRPAVLAGIRSDWLRSTIAVRDQSLGRDAFFNQIGSGRLGSRERQPLIAQRIATAVGMPADFVAAFAQTRNRAIERGTTGFGKVRTAGQKFNVDGFEQSNTINHRDARR